MKLDQVEKNILFEGIFQKFGYDFRRYADASIDRRLEHILGNYGLNNLIELLNHIFKSQDNFREFIDLVTIGTTEFFRDPEFFKAIRTEVIPHLKTFSRINVWHAGCSTGEEVISLAMIFKEEGLQDRTTVYATDISEAALKVASKGTYDLSKFKDFNKKYLEAGGEKTPSDYYTAEYGLGRFDPSLLKNVVFSRHNLATDSNFIEAHLILCRNVIIYFNRELQDRVFRLFATSLSSQGVLTIGPKESIIFSKEGELFRSFQNQKSMYTLKRVGL